MGPVKGILRADSELEDEAELSLWQGSTLNQYYP